MIRVARWIGLVTPKTKVSHNQGFTLVETILAVTLAGLTIAVLTAAFMNAVHLQKLVQDRVYVMVLGESKLAELENGSENGSSNDFPAPYANYKWSAQEEAVDDGSTKIILTVDWSDANGSFTHSRIFQGYRLPQ